MPLSLSEHIVFEPERQSDKIRELYALIHRLGKIERSIILLWLDEKSYQEIADITGFLVANVATRLKRVKEKLKKLSAEI